MSVQNSTESDETVASDDQPFEAGHYIERIDEIGTALSSDVALGLILVDGSSLERIERSYGVEAHRRAIETLRNLIGESCRENFEVHDVIVGGSSSPDEIVVLFFRPRSADLF